jgi:hypothetical protein
VADHGTPLPGTVECASNWGILPPPAPHLDRFATPTSFGLIGPTLCRLFKRLGARSLLQRRPAPPDLERGAGRLLPGIPSECLDRNIITLKTQPTWFVELTNPTQESNAGHIGGVGRRSWGLAGTKKAAHVARERLQPSFSGSNCFG